MKPSRLAVDAVVALFLFGCIPVVIRAISANPLTIGVFRLAVASIVMILAGLVRHPADVWPRSRADAARLVVIGFLFFAHLLTFFVSVKVSSASIAAIGLSTYGIFLIVFGAVFSHHRLRAAEICAVVVAAAGAVIVVQRFDFANNATMGMLLAVASAIFYASMPLLHQRWSHLRTGTRATGQFAFAFLFFLLLLPWTRWDLTRRDWYGLIFLAVGPTLIAHTLWVRVTTILPPVLTSVIYYGNIPIAILLSVLVLSEPVTPHTFLGAAMIIGGGAAGLLVRARSDPER